LVRRRTFSSTRPAAARASLQGTKSDGRAPVRTSEAFRQALEACAAIGPQNLVGPNLQGGIDWVQDRCEIRFAFQKVD
jgi:hypothetical protein